MTEPQTTEEVLEIIEGFRDGVGWAGAFAGNERVSAALEKIQSGAAELVEAIREQE